MTGFWILIWIFSFMYPVQPGRRWVTAQSPTESPVYQPDKELSVDIGDSATLRCCITKRIFSMAYLFKQPNRKKPQLIVNFYKTKGETFYNGFQESRFQIERSSNCFNLTILNIIQSDEAMYYCALMEFNPVFGDGTDLKIKERSKPALCDNSVVCEPTLHGNSTNMNTQEKTVLGLGTALGLCGLLIFCLTYFILRRRKCDKINTSVEDCPGLRQESHFDSLTYEALQVYKRKVQPGERDYLLYTDVMYAKL